MSTSLVPANATQSSAANSQQPVVAADHLTKRFDQRPVLRNVSFALPAGEVLALFGPNGAGKTTLLRVLATLVRPSSGTATLLGLDLATEADALRFRIGYVGHRPHLYEALTARENLLFFGRMFGLRDAADRADALLARVGLTAKARERVGNLSRGQVQRLALARSVLHKPGLLLLDEPDTGLDAEALSFLDTIIAEQRARGGSVILSTHAIERGLATAGTALVLVRGRVVFTGPSRALTAEQVAALYAKGGEGRV